MQEGGHGHRIRAAVRSDAVIDLVLTDVAETLIRSRSKRPLWLRPGFPMKLILSQKRVDLITYLVDHPGLRSNLRKSNRRLINSQLLGDVTASDFEARMEASADPYRFVATALLAEDDGLVRAARRWALDPTIIPVPVRSPLETPEPDRRAVEPNIAAADDAAVAPDADGAAESATPPVAAGVPPLTTTGGDVRGSEEDEPPAGPIVDSGIQLLVASLTAERDGLSARVAKLEEQLSEARSRIPTTNQRRRQNKQKGRLEQAERDLETANRDLAALQDERDRLIQVRKEVEDQLAEAEEARAIAQRKSQILERQLSSAEGRAEYLRRSLDKELSELQAAVQDLPNGRERSDANRRIATLTKLTTALEEAFPRDVEPEVRSRRVVVGPIHDFVVTPIGGGTEIGGSAILVEAAGRRILVDAGMHPSGRGPLHIQDVISGGPIDALIVTHAHNDHAGYVPALVSKFPRMRVICSSATQHLLPTMWADSAKVMDRAFSEAEEGVIAPPPLYGLAEVEEAEGLVEVHASNRAFNIGDLHLTLFPAGHILGAVGVVIDGGGRRVVITGDISGLEDHYLSVESASIPEGLVRNADLLVIETTYCNADHDSRRSQERGLVETTRQVIERRGRVLIPAFGLGRAQEVVMILQRELPQVDVLVDGLAKDVTRIYETIASDAGRSLTILEGRVQPVLNRSRELQSFQTGVIVASSGMLTGGPSVAWAKSILPDDRAALLLCGYQDEEAPGRKLEHLSAGWRERTLRLPDEDFGWIDVPVRAEVGKYGLSAHADKGALIDIIERIRPQSTMLVHGLPDNQATFRMELARKSIRTVPTDRWSSCPN